MQILRCGAAEAGAYRDEVRGVWESAFGEIGHVGDWEQSIWERHRGREAYRLVVAREDEVLLGFGWGYTGERGQYWSDLVAERLGANVQDWVGGHFEFVELAVAPAARGRGVGGRLHDALLAELPHDRALLGTVDEPDDPAVRLYRSRGWQRLGETEPGRQVMGLRLSEGR